MCVAEHSTFPLLFLFKDSQLNNAAKSHCHPKCNKTIHDTEIQTHPNT
uniref:Uncharacterized protein n=1 Tax=Manihot esculenta TaxID=3983 RepID=A0A2C9W1G2_MANES